MQQRGSAIRQQNSSSVHEAAFATVDPQPMGQRVFPWLFASLTLLLGLIITSWLAIAEKQRDQRDAQHAFVMEVQQAADAITLQLGQCEQLIRAFQSVFLASDQVTPEEFAVAYANMQGNNEVRVSLQALAYAQRQPARSGEHYLTRMAAPMAGNTAIIGLDVADQPQNLEALLRSRDSNKVAMSAPFRLLQGQLDQHRAEGLILRLPVYASGQLPATQAHRQAAIVGSIGASFRITDLLAPAVPPAPRALAAIRIDDISTGTAHLLYEKHLSDAANTPPVRMTIHFGGRQWQVTGYPQSQLWAQGNWITVLALGGAISLLLAVLAWSLASTRARAIALGTLLGQRYLASEERFRRLNELLPCLVLLVRQDNGNVVYRNAAARARLSDACDFSWLSIQPRFLPQQPPSPILGAPQVERDMQLLAIDGSLFWASTWTCGIEIDGSPMWLLVASDVSEQRHLTERLSYQASHDSLTRLFNRHEFERRVQVLLAGPDPGDGAMLFLDLDQFKLINDISGHRAGDELLTQLAAVMQEKLRPLDVLARLGGDEFGVLLPGVSDLDTALQAAERLRRCIEAFSFGWEGRNYTISASIGVVMLRDTSSMKELFAHADAACYLAKEAGRNRTHAYTDADAAITRRLSEMEWANRVRDALRDGRLLLDYQELHPLQPQAAAGAHIELLLRLRGEDGSVVMPGAFLPAAERYGLMPLIDRWVVESALAHLDQLHPDGVHLASCAINLSAASLEDTGLYERIKELLTLYRVLPSRITFEITETVAMRDFAASSALIGKLRALGCKVALDDFGAGMSSFGYLKNLELDVVKIDGSFVQNMLEDRMSQAIVRAVTEIGHLQGLDVVAEWVSSPQLCALLATMDVDYAQGFSLHRPERVCFQRDAENA